MFIRKDGKVKAEVVFDNGEIVCYHASWQHKDRTIHNRFTTRSTQGFEENFNIA